MIRSKAGQVWRNGKRPLQPGATQDTKQGQQNGQPPGGAVGPQRPQFAQYAPGKQAADDSWRDGR